MQDKKRYLTETNHNTLKVGRNIKNTYVCTHCGKTFLDYSFNVINTGKRVSCGCFKKEIGNIKLRIASKKRLLRKIKNNGKSDNSSTGYLNIYKSKIKGYRVIIVSNGKTYTKDSKNLYSLLEYRSKIYELIQIPYLEHTIAELEFELKTKIDKYNSECIY